MYVACIRYNIDILYVHVLHLLRSTSKFNVIKKFFHNS